MRWSAGYLRLSFLVTVALLTGLLAPVGAQAHQSTTLSRPLPPGQVSARARPAPHRPSQAQGRPGDAWHRKASAFNAGLRARNTQHAQVEVQSSAGSRARRMSAALRAAHALPKRPGHTARQRSGPSLKSLAHPKATAALPDRAPAAWDSAAAPLAANPYGASYSPEIPFAIQPAHDVEGAMWVTITNTSTMDWPANSIDLSYHLYRSDNSVYSYNGYGGTITTAVARGKSVRVLASVERLPAGSFKLVWDARFDDGTGTDWFTTHGVPASGTLAFTIPHSAPSAGLVSPQWAAVVPSLRPELDIQLSADKTAAVQAQFQVCANAAATSGCHDSGWLDVTMGDSFDASAYWRPADGHLPKWNTTYYWRARVKDSVTTPWSTMSPFTTVVSPAGTGGARYGVDPATLDPAGVSLFNGNYTRDETDLSVPVPDGSQPLAVNRVYNSAGTANGAFGTGWSSILDAAIDPTPEGWVRATFKDGKQIQFGKNSDGTWAPSFGEGDSVKYEVDSGGVPWLRFKDGTSAEFGPAGGHQPLRNLRSPTGSMLQFFVTGGHITQIRENLTGRSVYLTWTGSHVTSATAGTDDAAVRWSTWNYTYTGNQLTKVCDAESPTRRCTSYTYGGTDSAHTVPRLTQVDRPKAGNTTKLAYQGDYLYTLKYPSSLVSGGWDTWFYRHTDPPAGDTNAALVVHTTDPAGVNLYYEFDAHGSLWSRWGGGPTPTHGNTRSWQYDATGRVSALIDENDNVTEYHWDSITGRLADQNRYRDTTGTIVNTHYEYDSTTYANTLSVADGNHHAVKMTYSGERLKTRTTPPAAAAPNGATTTYGYTCDSGTRPPVVNDPSAPTGSYQPCGLLATVTDPDGHVTRYGYDRFGQRTLEQLPTGGTVNSFYDVRGYITQQVASATPGGSGYLTWYAYDTHGRVTAEGNDGVPNPIEGWTNTLVVNHTYDEDGNLASTSRTDSIDREGSPDPIVQTFAYDARDRLTSSTIDGKVTSRQQYDGVGHVADSWDANGQQYHYYYDSRGLLGNVTMPAYSDTPGQSGAATRSVRVRAYDYDDAGRLVDFWDAKGHVVSYTYTNDDLLRTESYIAHADPDHPDSTRDVLLHTYAYDQAGNLLSDVEGGGSTARTTTYGYDDANERTSFTVDPGGLARATRYSYDPAGLITGTSVSDGTRTESTTQVYDPASGALVKSSVHNDATPDLVTQYTRDAFGRVLTVTDPRGVKSLTSTDPPDPAYTTTYAYDAAGRVATVTGPPVAAEDGSGAAAQQTRPVTTYGYDSFGQTTGIRNPAGGVTQLRYDSRGNLAQFARPDHSSEVWQYDYAGNLTYHSDSESGQTYYAYDSRNRPRTATRWIGGISTGKADGVYTSAWDDNSNLLSTITPTGAQTLNTYDDMDRRQTRNDVVRNGTSTPDQNITQFRYDDFGEPVHTWQVIGGKTFESRSGYDAAGELCSQSETGRGTTYYAHDVAGRLTRVTDPLTRATETTYDLAGRPSAVTAYDAGGTTALAHTDYTVDPAGNTTAVKDPNGHVWKAGYDAADRLTTLTDPAPTAADGTTAPSPVTSVGYDVLGDATRLTDADRHTTYQTYGTGGQILTRVEPATTAHPAAADRTWSYSYGSGGHVSNTSEPGGVSTSYTYDSFHRLTGQSATGAEGGAATRDFGYDQDGRLTSIGAPGGTETFTYDDRNLLTGSTGVLGTSSYKYDSLGRLTEQTDPVTTIDYGYSGLRDVGSVTDGLTGDWVSYTRDPAGQLKKITGVAQGEAGFSTRDFAYDGLGRVTSETVTPEAPFQDRKSSLSYTWDKAGNLRATTRSGGLVAPGTTGYDYDEDNRLVRATTTPADGTTTTGADYAWDAVGNRTAATTWSGSAHTATGTSNAQYDERNRLKSATAPGGTTTGYDWTARGTLARTTTTTGGSTTSTAQLFDSFDRLVGDGKNTYAYDSLDRLVSSSDGTSTRRLSYGGLTREPVGDGTWSYARTADGGLLSAKKGSGSPQRLVQDVHGDVVAGLGMDFGDISSSRSYDAFGAVTAKSSAGADLSVGFQGSWTDPASGRVSAESRWYDSGTGTFASEDTASVPLTGATSANAYLYAGANPTSRLDPDGHWGIPGLGAVADLGADAIGLLGSAISEGAGLAAGAAEVGGEVIAGAAAVVAAPEELLIIGGVLVVVTAAALASADINGSTLTIDTPGVTPVTTPPPPTAVVAPPPSHPIKPTKPIVIGTKKQTSTTSWQTSSKWYDETYLYTRTDYYSYTTTKLWTYYDNGTVGYQWWRSPTSHRWTVDVKPLIDLDHTVKVETDAAAKPQAPSVNGAAPLGGRCRTGGNIADCASRSAPLPQGATDDTPETATDGAGGDGPGTPPGAGMCTPDPDDGEWVDPDAINFSQRTVSPNDYVESMENGTWDWNRPGTALQVIERDGQLISYDNRRLDAAREVRAQNPDYRVRIQRVDPDAANPAKTSGMTWDQSFEKRMKSKRNWDENGCRVPWQGLSERPEVEEK